MLKREWESSLLGTGSFGYRLFRNRLVPNLGPFGTQVELCHMFDQIGHVQTGTIQSEQRSRVRPVALPRN